MDKVIQKLLSSSGVEGHRRVSLVLSSLNHSHPLVLFGSLLSIIHEQLSIPSSPLLPPSTLILSSILPFIPPSILSLKLPQISSLLIPILSSHSHSPQIIRSVSVCLKHLLLTQPSLSLLSPPSSQILLSLLLLSTNPTPKIRKTAADALKTILSSPPPPSTSHPLTPRALDFYIHLFIQFSQSPSNKQLEQKVFYSLSFLKSFIPSLSSKSPPEKILIRLQKLSHSILSIPSLSSRSGNIFLTQSVFHLLSSFINPLDSPKFIHKNLTHEPTIEPQEETQEEPQEENQEEPTIEPQEEPQKETPSGTLPPSLIISIIQKLLLISPNENDPILTPLWLNLLSDCFLKLSEAICQYSNSTHVDQDETSFGTLSDEFCSSTYPSLVQSVFAKIFSSYFSIASSAKPIILQHATILLSTLVNPSISNSMLNNAINTLSIADNNLNNINPDSCNDNLLKIIIQINSSLSGIQFRDAWGYILLITSSFFDRIGPSSPPLITPSLHAIFAFRDDPAFASVFPYKEELARATHSAINALGLSAFSSIIPLNIENEFPNQPRRPYLLASFAEALHLKPSTSQWYPNPVFGPHSLEFFASTLLPLASRLLEKSSSLAQSGKMLESKLYETLGIQSWDLFPLICSSTPPDVASQFGILAPHLGRILQSTPKDLIPHLPSKHDFRICICEGLATLIQSYHTLSTQPNHTPQTITIIQSGLTTITSYATRFLGTLCNNYTSIHPNTVSSTNMKSQALQMLHEREIQHYEKTIRSFLRVANVADVTEYVLTLMRVVVEYQTRLQSITPSSSNMNINDSVSGPSKASSTMTLDLDRLRIYSSLDLALIMVPFLPVNEMDPVSQETPLGIMYRVLLGHLTDTDPVLQKRTYKVLVGLVTHISSIVSPSSVCTDMYRDLGQRLFDDNVVSRAVSTTKRYRIRLIECVCVGVDKAVMKDMIVMGIPECILATKEASEKTREAAYECMVGMGKLIMSSTDDMEKGEKDGGLLLMNALDNETDVMQDITTSQPSSDTNTGLRDFILMVVAGLAATSPHMQSATISTLSRLIYEFSTVISPSLIHDLIQTIITTMTQTQSREIVKSVLGFIKVCIVTIPQEHLELDLEDIIQCVVVRTKGYGATFKSKVRHVMERLIRKFSYEVVEGFVGEGDRKMVLNIRKRRDRIKKQKAMKKKCGDVGDNGGEEKRDKKMAYHDTINDSDSDLGSDSDHDNAYIPDDLRDDTRRNNRGNEDTCIKNDGDDVTDFLDMGIVSRISCGDGDKRRHGHGGNGEGIRVGDDGRIVVNNSNDEQDDGNGNNTMEVEHEDMYRLSLNSEASVMRRRDGKLRFIDKHKRDEHDTEPGIFGGGGGTGTRWGIRKQSNTMTKAMELSKQASMDRMLGKQYQSKHARGDTKKPGMPDPHAYIPLNARVVGTKHKGVVLDDGMKRMLKGVKMGVGKKMGGGGKKFTGGGVGKKSNKKHK